MDKIDADDLKTLQANKSPLTARLEGANDGYDEYLLDRPLQRDERSNPSNLFDDSNRTDRYWLRRAREYLGKLRQPL